MKKLFIISVLAFMLGGCSGASPSEAVGLFYHHAQQGEIDKAERFVADEVKQVFKGGSLYGTLSAGIQREADKYTDLKAKSTTVNGQTATVTVEATYPDGSTGIEEMNLIKESGVWKLTFQ